MNRVRGSHLTRQASWAGCAMRVTARNGGTDRRQGVVEHADRATRPVGAMSTVEWVHKSGDDTQTVSDLLTRWRAGNDWARSPTQPEVRCGHPAVRAT
jgi:hypothetical protein